MITLSEKSQCCGCEACAQICPKDCITMEEDNEGFLYPHIDISLCIGCNLCEKICPELNPITNINEPISIYAAKNTNESVRLVSSSGGIFSVLAEQIIEMEGVVFGALFNEKWEVYHGYVDNKQDLKRMYGSKYVQSRINNSFIDARRFLREGKFVLFSGTACQIYALKRFLGKDYPKLLTVDVICHGVPSPKVWKRYLEEISHGRIIKSIKFRDKVTGWKNYSSIVEYENTQSDCLRNFMSLFLSNYILRPSCHSCLFKNGRCTSDITLGDFWGINLILLDFHDDKGISVVLMNRESLFIDLLKFIDYKKVTTNDALLRNPSFKVPVKMHPNREFFFFLFNKTNSVLKSYRMVRSTNPFIRIYRILFRKILG